MNVLVAILRYNHLVNQHVIAFFEVVAKVENWRQKSRLREGYGAAGRSSLEFTIIVRKKRLSAPPRIGGRAEKAQLLVAKVNS